MVFRRGALVALTAGLALPAQGSAAQHEGEGIIPPTFRAAGSGGYLIRGLLTAPRVAAGDGSDLGRVSLVLLVQRRSTLVTYQAPAEEHGSGRIHAELGALGSVDLRFVPSGGTALARPWCGGEALRYRRGRFVGRLRFRGEEGYTRVSTRSARPDVSFLLDIECPGESGTTVGGGPGAQLRALRDRGDGNVTLEVAKRSPSAPAHVAATISEDRGRLLIRRSVGAVVTSAAFRWSGSSRAILKPPAPFGGSAVYEQGSGGRNRWRGSLTVDFPGNSNVPMAGTGFSSVLRQVRFVGSVIL